MKSVDLPSGRKLTITLAPFITSRALYQAFLEELKGVKIEGSQELDYNFMKDLAIIALASKKFESALEECMKRCLINDLKIDNGSFEKEEHRDDYFTVMFEVAKENILPFTKSLSAQFGHLFALLKTDNQA